MESSLVHNGFNLERRKQYTNNPRHNLNSSVSFVWRESLDSYPMKRSGLMKYEKQLESQTFKSRYNQMMDEHIKKEMNIPVNSNRVMPAQRYLYHDQYLQKRQYSRDQPIESLQHQLQHYGYAKNQFQNMNQQSQSYNYQPQIYQQQQQYQYQNPHTQMQMRQSNSLPLRNPPQRSFYAPNQNPYKGIQQYQRYYQDNNPNEFNKSKSLMKTGNSNENGNVNNETRIPQKPAGHVNHSQANVSKAIFGYDVNKIPEKKNSYFNQILNSRLQPYLAKGKQGVSNGTTNSNSIKHTPNDIEYGKQNGTQKHQSFSINHPVYMNY